MWIVQRRMSNLHKWWCLPLHTDQVWCLYRTRKNMVNSCFNNFLFCSRYWTALICDRIQRSLRKPWLNGKNCSSCERTCEIVRVSMLGNRSVFCIVAVYKAYIFFCRCVVFLWRTKSRLANSRYIIETPEEDQKWSRFVETAHSLLVFWCLAQLPAGLCGCVVSDVLNHNIFCTIHYDLHRTQKDNTFTDWIKAQYNSFLSDFISSCLGE